MKWNQNQLRWECKARINGFQHDSTHAALKTEKESPFLHFLTVKQLGKFIRFSVYYFDSSTYVQTASQYVGIGLDLGYQWGLRIRQSFGKIKNYFKIKLGDNGSTLEMDATYYGKNWKYRHSKKPQNYGKTNVFVFLKEIGQRKEDIEDYHFQLKEKVY